MTKTSTLVTAAVLLAAGASFAGSPMVGHGKTPPQMPTAPGCSTEISYNSFEADWNHTFISEPGFDDANGVGIKLEYSPINQVYLVGEGDWSNSSLDGHDLTGWGVLAGVGGYLPITPNLHFATDLGGIWEGSKLSGDGRVSDGGFYVRPHFRARFACAEIHVGAKFVSMNDFGDRWEVFTDVYYEIAPHIDLTVGAAVNLENSDKDWALKAGARYRF
jgi:hypothetical protein